MATVTHYIYSHYTPPERHEEDRPEHRTEEDDQDPWLTESTFGASRRVQNAPSFVPALVSYDEINGMIGGASSSISSIPELSTSSQVSNWYKSLPRSSSAPSTAPVRLSSPLPAKPVHAAPQPSTPSGLSSADQPKLKNNWFSSNVPHSDPSSSRSTPAPTLADILAREPPPEKKDQPFVPPVFLHIGPSNKGFAMLQQSGWSEGEALGAGASRRSLSEKAKEKKPSRTILDDLELSVKVEEREIVVGTDDDVQEVRRVEVVDLTLSDSDEDEIEAGMELGGDFLNSSAAPTHNPKALLTPIATVLKSDRLGIGLKAKTVGPYKESKKRVTHNQAALAAHIKANEEMRLRKAIIGRGAKSFARLAKAEAEKRKQLLATLNAD